MHPLSPPPLKAWLAAALVTALFLFAIGMVWNERAHPNLTICPLCGK